MHIGLSTAITAPRGLPDIIAALFAAGEPGVRLDPSDLSTMFTDSAGSTAVTTPGQTVGMVLDKSKGLVLGSDVVKNGDFSGGSTDWVAGANWNLGGGSAVSNGTAGDLYQSGFVANATYRVEFTVTAYASGNLAIRGGAGFQSYGVGTHTLFFRDSAGLLVFQSSNYNGTIDNVSVKALPGNHVWQTAAASRPTYGIMPEGGIRNLLISTDALATQSRTVTAVSHVLSFTGTGSIALSGTATGTLAGTGANRVSLTFTPTAGTLTLTVSGSVTLAQLETGSAVTNYQKVGSTRFDVTEAGKRTLHRLEFDGISHFFVTPANLDLSSTDKLTVWAGVRKLSDAAQGILAELSVNASTTAAAFALSAPDGATATYSARSNGSLTTAGSAVTAATFAAPHQGVLTFKGDIAADLASLSVNGGAAVLGAGDQGVGNYGALPLYIGRRGGSTLPFSGDLFSLIVRGAATADPAPTNRLVGQETGVAIA